MISKLLQTESVVKNASVFSTNFIPPEKGFIGREDQITRLAHIVRPILTENISTNVILIGSGSSGKTTLTRVFFKAMREIETTKKLAIYYIDACQFNTEASVLRYIGSQINCFASGCGFSVNEMYRSVISGLKRENLYGVFIIDEATRLNRDALFSLLNSSTSFGESHSPFSFFLICRKADYEQQMTEQIMSRINHLIELTPYTVEQIRDILKWRINNGLRFGVISDADLDFLAVNVIDHNLTLREAIGTVYEAALRCDIMQSSQISHELFAKVVKEKSGNALIFREKIENLPLQERLALLTILKHERLTPNTPVLVDDLYPMYVDIAHQIGITPHVKMSLRKYIRCLSRDELITVNIQNPSEDRRGRRLSIKPAFYSDEFETFVQKGIET